MRKEEDGRKTEKKKKKARRTEKTILCHYVKGFKLGLKSRY